MPQMTLNEFQPNKRQPFNLEQNKTNNPDIIEDDFWQITAEVWDYTVAPVPVLYNLYLALKYIYERDLPGDIVECGVLLGGLVMMMERMALLHDRTETRRIFALDTFTGFVRHNAELDKDLATGRAAALPNRRPVDFSDGAISNMRSINFPRLDVVKGDVLETIPTLPVDQISLLRLDTDTYDTTKYELESLYHKVVVGGVVIIDDYGYTWGCKKAVDDFVANRRIMVQRVNRYCRFWVKSFAE